MGHTVEAKCLDCGKSFEVDHGGGFFFHLVRCVKCGKTKAIRFDELGILHLQFLKGLQGPYCVASAEHDKDVRENAPVEPISREEYYSSVETIAGKCNCGGKFTFDAPPRCPKCHSTKIEEGKFGLCYD